jgi:hypothetical protein
MIGSEIQDGDGHSGKLFELSDASGKWVEAQVRWGAYRECLRECCRTLRVGFLGGSHDRSCGLF